MPHVTPSLDLGRRAEPKRTRPLSATSRQRRRLAAALIVLGVACMSSPRLAPTGAAAPLIQPASGDGHVSCLTRLTDAEVAAVVGRPSVGRMNESAAGSSQCRWDWPESDASVTASYADDAAIGATAAATRCCTNPSAPLVHQFFDYSVRLEQELGSDLPVPLTGLGQRATLFFDDAFLKLIVQRPDGVAQLVGTHVTREQLLALARAMVQ